MKPRRFPLWLSAGLGLAFAGFIAWWLVRSREILVELPDGGRVRLLGTTYGVEHRFSDGSSWVKLIQRWISPRRALELGLRNYLHQSPGTNLVIWTDWQFAPTNGLGLLASVADEAGVESDPSAPVVSHRVPKRNEKLVAWQFNNFPRRSAEIRLRFYSGGVSYEGVTDSSRPRFLAEMPVPNPVQTRVPMWEAPHAPVTAKSGEFEFTLNELECGKGPSQQTMPARAVVPPWRFAPPSPWTSAAFVVRKGGELVPDWRLRYLAGFSASGNSFVVPVPQVWQKEGATLTEFHHLMWPEDGAWRITAEFSQESRFPPDQMWTFRNVPLRPGTPTVLSNLAVTVHGITLTNLSVSILPPTQLQPSLVLRNVKMDLRFTPSIPGVRVDLIEAADERGRRLDFNPSYEFPPGTYSTLLGARGDPKSIDLTFAIQPSHTVEFLATPTFVNSNAPSAFPRRTGAATNLAK